MRVLLYGCGAMWLVLAGCDSAASTPDAGSAAPSPQLSIEALQDPKSCAPCHAEHYREWASSMHAYAARDPVFIAMNERGQRETQGALGEFCVRCHAPMALELGLTRDGLNLPDLDDPNARGVTCYFCHDVNGVEADHNRGLTLAGDAVMRGGLGSADRSGEERNAQPPRDNRAHASAYSPLHDGERPESAALCGACHDVVNDHGAPIERTFAEWRGSSFAQPGPDLQTCAGCHMPAYAAPAAAQGPERNPHRHLWPGVDLALEPSFPGIAAQTAAIDCAFEGALGLELAATGPEPEFDRFEVTLTNLGVGHAWPSGAAQDRRAWVEFVAYDAGGEVLLQSGVVADGEVVGDADDQLRILRDRLYDENGEPVHMFWEAAPSTDFPLGHSSDLVPAPSASGEAAAVTLSYALPAPATRVTARLRLQAIGLDVLDDFQGMTLPITERVLGNGYVQGNTLRTRVRTLTVPGTERTLELRDGRRIASGPPEASADCAEHAYVALLPAD